MNSGDLKALAVAGVAIACLVALIMGANLVGVMLIGGFSIMAIDEL